ncbi:ScbA/BarX family gamma-butyrolactone biosynthesis protein [Actinokineospora diospyrosa]|uniref:A-factor biosynthesis hotdog domain-containing protein n=1 Tax=Actinokineospora diospyrosa TaxID=103728 RepID=A0ABT1IIX1_9PSEU|nr:ScbA/BarX family gamma-butyrolactone biosynthesis protein [Actinokineospora diospyrosa]MCP2272608.1 A-factor biosynthesis hotdog domain-containing protein [Actinokineospora diospyrosa]
MTTALDGPDLSPALAGLRYLRTVDRSLLHRSSLSEVFLTDARRVGERRYLAAAQLPPSHAYYTDHALRVPAPDPLLLLEVVRQAETYGGHAYFAVPATTKFILRSWTVRLPGLLAAGATGSDAVALDVRTGGRRGLPGRLRALTYDTAVYLGGVAVGEVVIDVGYLSGESYRQLRVDRRGGAAPPSSVDMAVPAPGVPARLVGRGNQANVVLAEAEVDAEHAVAALRVPVDNRSMFDHAQDHVPGMVLMEAARQLCLLAGEDYFAASPARTAVVGFDFSFSRYAELDASTAITLFRPTNAEPVLAAALPDVRTYPVQFAQHGEAIAVGTMSTATFTTAALAGPAITAVPVVAPGAGR